MDKLKAFDLLARVIKCKATVQNYEQGAAAEMIDAMKEVPSFVNYLKKYFAGIKSKVRDGGRAHVKMLLLYDSDLENLIEMVKEEMSEFKVYLYRQEVAHDLTETSGLRIKLHTCVYIQFIMKSTFDEEVKKQVDVTLDFALLSRAIFNGEKVQISSSSFTSKGEKCPRAINVEVRSEQDLTVTSEIRKIMKSERFKKTHKVTVCFSPRYEFGQNTRMKT